MKPAVDTVKENNKEENRDNKPVKLEKTQNKTIKHQNLGKSLEAKNQLKELRFSQKSSVQEEITYFFPKVLFQPTEVRKKVFY